MIYDTNYQLQTKKAKLVNAYVDGEAVLKAIPELYLIKESGMTSQRWIDYYSYAKPPSWCKTALDRIVGYISEMQWSAKATLPPQLEYLTDEASVYGDGLDSIALRCASAQATDGRVGLLVNPTEDNHMVIVEIPMVRIISVQYSSVGGRDKAVKVVLSNRDPYEFTQVPLIYKVLSLDVEGHYTYSEYDVKRVEDIEKATPILTLNPTLYGRKLAYIPFVVINASNLSGASYSDPYLLPLAYLSSHAYNADAAYRRTLRCTSDPTMTIIGGTGKVLGELSETAGSVNWLPQDYSMTYTEFTGAGAAAQRQALIDLAADAEQHILAIRADTNLSGRALSVIMTSQMAGFSRMVDVLCDGIEIALRYMADWAGTTAGQYRLRVASGLVSDDPAKQ